MKTNNLYSENWCNIVFENRNQSYGAYQIRKVTNPNTFVAFLGTLLLFGSLIGVPKAVNWLYGEKIVRELPPDIIPDVPFYPNIPEEVLPPEPKTEVKPPPAPMKTEIMTTPVIIEKEVKELPKTNEELLGKETSNQKTEGTGTVQTITTEKGTGTEIVEPVVPEKPKIFEGWQLSVLPSFVGGDVPMNKFLIDRTHYPEMEKAEGIEGTVYVTFIVTSEGKVANVEIARKGSAGLEKEALRVVKLMPDWIPGKQNGQAVNTKMILPIRFKLY